MPYNIFSILILNSFLDKSRKMKELTFNQVQFYGEGLMRWMQTGEMSLEDMTSGGKVYKLIAVLCDSPFRESVDSDFNGMSFDALCEFLNINGQSLI